MQLFDVAVGVGVGVFVLVTVGVGVRVLVGVPVGVGVRVTVGVAVRNGAGVRVELLVFVGVAVRVSVGVAVRVGVGVGGAHDPANEESHVPLGHSSLQSASVTQSLGTQMVANSVLKHRCENGHPASYTREPMAPLLVHPWIGSNGH